MPGYNWNNYPAYNPGYTPGQPWQGNPVGQQYTFQPTQGNFQQQGNANQPAFICYPVTSREEAVAQRVEAFGPGLIMPDMGHGMIYFKKFNNETALADFSEFRYVHPQQEEPKQAPFDFGAIISTFTSRLDNIDKKMEVIAGSILEKKVTKSAAKTETKGAVEK